MFSSFKTGYCNFEKPGILKFESANHKFYVFLVCTKTRSMLTPSEMKDRLLRLVHEGNFIEGIYNYCDRWCERCSFTSRCLNFESSKNAPPPDSPELFNYLKNVMEAAILMLEEKMKEFGIEPEEIEKLEPPGKPDPQKHPLYKKVYGLSMSMHKWLEKNNPHETINRVALNEVPDKIKKARLKDVIEVICYYNFFISAKIYRALITGSDFEKDEIQNDSNGSAKIALIALDRLIASWSLLLENMPNHEDEILGILVKLAEVRTQTENTFPLARKFRRPGFDD